MKSDFRETGSGLTRGSLERSLQLRILWTAQGQRRHKSLLQFLYLVPSFLRLWRKEYAPLSKGFP